MKNIKFIRMNDVLELTGIKSRTTIHNWMKQDKFPKSVRMSPRITVWDYRSIEKWQQGHLK